MESFLKGRVHIKKSSYQDDELVDNGKPSDKDALKPLLTDKLETTEEVVIESAADEEIPKVQVISEDGSVKKIIIQCTCGKCLELECEYDEELINNLRRLKKAKK